MHSISPVCSGGCHPALLAALAMGAFLLAAAPALAQPARERRNFDNGWRFHLGEVLQRQSPTLADKSWRAVDLPHDCPFRDRTARRTRAARVSCRAA
jgi:hypothetical protein